MAPKDSTLPIDPNVKVPDAVKRAAARAEAHYQPATPASITSTTCCTRSSSTGNGTGTFASSTAPACAACAAACPRGTRTCSCSAGRAT